MNNSKKGSKRTKNFIPFVKVGPLCRYRPEDIEAWLQQNAPNTATK